MTKVFNIVKLATYIRGLNKTITEQRPSSEA